MDNHLSSRLILELMCIRVSTCTGRPPSDAASDRVLGGAKEYREGSPTCCNLSAGVGCLFRKTRDMSGILTVGALLVFREVGSFRLRLCLSFRFRRCVNMGTQLINIFTRTFSSCLFQLFGHEIVAILVGDVWGVGIGFGIVAAGTLLGELGNFMYAHLFQITH